MRVAPTIASEGTGTPDVSAVPGLWSAHPDPRADAVVSELHVPPLKGRIRFHYTGLSLQEPRQVRFRHRLEGYDREWVEAEDRRVAVYTGLPPGTYSFRVRACNNDGVWNETGAALCVVVQPAWWQTWGFRGLAGTGAVGALVLVIEARLRRSRRERAAQKSFSRRLLESQEEERKQIGRASCRERV